MQVMKFLNFNQLFIKCIGHLFFGNVVQVNANGFMSPTVYREWGLRQGDPLSPILFNLALKPLLLSIQQDAAITSYQYTYQGIPQYVKTIAYADDICVILHSQHGFQRLQLHLQRYADVLNAKFKKSKTKAFSLNEQRYNDWNHQHIVLNFFRYLGFYMVYTIAQRNII